ncbi:hypothetical protein, partial [Collinsella sp. AM43-1]|uniref:hypothetical protein n=1 Tax=Collinsella sp. AM43-1 TaxID=2292322 RepID=UPI001F3AE2F4
IEIYRWPISDCNGAASAGEVSASCAFFGELYLRVRSFWAFLPNAQKPHQHNLSYSALSYTNGVFTMSYSN